MNECLSPFPADLVHGPSADERAGDHAAHVNAADAGALLKTSEKATLELRASRPCFALYADPKQAEFATFCV